MKTNKVNLDQNILLAPTGTGKPNKTKENLISFLQDYHSLIVNDSLEEKAEEKLTGAFFSKFSFNENFAFKLIYQAVVLKGVWIDILGNFINCLKELSYNKAVTLSEMDIKNKGEKI
ncbi:hypothetical protein C1631_022795 [Chryseobacterium phosphatilyticum]|uniref:Uncharacterized protein n=1 Tax=Chryseobacterium phosphatilyticum TaxID=475075 RepID=A0A316WPH8_9FLAO|nr:hypothetical protein [Chryseobacterium phosphatilyticum]PWN62396.1 hypothetical protein C1631_022795 [Chryseobacterium phosphatilyticum]